MSAIPGSVPVTGFIAPTDSGDLYPVIDPLYGIDGYRSVADHTARNAIGNARRRYGMFVFTQNDDKVWRLKASPWAGDDTDWVEFTGGGGGGSPGGNDTDVQFNNTGAFDGVDSFVFTLVDEASTLKVQPDQDTGYGKGQVQISAYSTTELMGNSAACLAVDAELSELAPNGSDITAAWINADTAIEGPDSAGTVHAIDVSVRIGGSGGATEVAGIYIGTFNTFGNPIPNLYGLLIGDQTGGTAHYAIKTGLGKVELGDKLLVHGVVGLGNAPYTDDSIGIEVNNEYHVDSFGKTAMEMDSYVYDTVTMTGNLAGLVIYTLCDPAGAVTGDLIGITIEADGGGGVAGNVYGLLINDAVGGASNYAIKTGLGGVLFSDLVGIGPAGYVSDPTKLLTIGKQTAADAASLTGLQLNIDNLDPYVLSGDIVGFSVNVTNQTDGGATNVFGGYIFVSNEAGTPCDAVYGLYFDQPAGGTYTYGIYIGDVSASLTSKAYAIKTGDGLVQFRDYGSFGHDGIPTNGQILDLVDGDATEGIHIDQSHNHNSVFRWGIKTNTTLLGDDDSLRNAELLGSIAIGARADIIGLSIGNSCTDAGTANRIVGEYIAGTFVTGAGSAVTDDYGLIIDTPSTASGGAITNHYGIKLEDQTASGVTNVWAIKTGTGKVDLGDNLILTGGHYIEGFEMSAPAAGAANSGRLFFQDNGSGKTQLMVIFSSGAAQQIAIQP